MSANTLKHLRFSKWKGSLQLEVHTDPNANPDLANRFTRKTVGSSFGKSLGRAIQANGAGTVFQALAIVAAASLPKGEGEALLADVAKLIGPQQLAVDASADPIVAGEAA